MNEIKKDIKKYKKALINKAKRKGLYEDFGQKEVRKLKDKYSDYMYKEEFEPIEDFNKWIINFNDKML